MTDKKGIEENLKRLREFNAERSDWYGTCRVCGEAVAGSLAEIRKHCHGSS